MRTRRWGLVGVVVLLVLALGGASPGRTAAQGPSLTVQLAYATFDPLVTTPSVPPELAAPPDAPYAIIQLLAPPTEAVIEELEQLGTRFHGYLPDFAYLARVDGADGTQLAAHPAVRWVGALHPAYLIAPGTTGGTLLVERFPDADPTVIEAALLLAGATLLDRDDGAGLFVLDAPDGALHAIAAIPGLRSIQNLHPVEELNDEARWLSQGGRLDDTPLHDRGLTGTGQVGAIADSGLAVYDFQGGASPLHNPVPSCYFVDDAGGAPALPSPAHRKVVGYTNPADSGGDRIDSTGHGTHVAGSLAGDRAPYGVVDPGDGQAIDARIFFQDLGRGIGFAENPAGEILPPTDYTDLFADAYDPDGDGLYSPGLEPRTHSNSWGSPQPIYSVQSAQVDRFMWSHPDFLIFYASGNQGPAANTIGYPATAKSIVTVGGSENGLADPDSMGYFSSHGPAPLGRLKPEIVAPGDRITSALHQNPCATADRNGTSMATPTAHGIALLMRQYLTEGFYPSGRADAAATRHPSAALLKALLMNSGRPMGGQHTDNAAGGSWPSNGQGWGRILADDALYFEGDRRALWLHDAYALDGSVGLASAGDSVTFTIEVADGAPFATEPLEITLVWSDYPGEPVSGGALVNDLDLVVIGPDGRTHLGNDPASNDFAGLPDLPPLAPDRINPWEGVFVADPAPGRYTITVRAHALGSIALDPARQGFALVATGDLLATEARLAFEFPEYRPNPAQHARLRLATTAHDPAATEQRVVRVESGSASLQVTLVESAPDSGLFVGEVELDSRVTPGTLTVTPGATILARYDDGGVTRRATARVGAAPLNFSNPPELAVPQNPDGRGDFTLTWQPAERTAGIAHYELQIADDYSIAFADDAEGALTDHWTTGPFLTPWQQDPTVSRSALFGYWSGRGDAALQLVNSLSLARDVVVPPGDAQLSLYSRYYNDFNDYGRIELSTDGGTSWTVLRELTADPRVVPPGMRMQRHQFDLSAYRGLPIRLRFVYDNGVLSYPPDSPGWWVDDIVVDGAGWRALGTASGTSLDVTGIEVGSYHMRVRARYHDGSASPWGDPVAATVTVPPTPEGGGRASGAGWLRAVDGSKLHHHFKVAAEGGRLEGRLEWRDRAADVEIRLDTIDAVGALVSECGGIAPGADSLEFRGDGYMNDAPARFRVCIEDGGHGRAAPDRLVLLCLSGCTYDSSARAEDALLDGGNIALHERPGGGSPPAAPAGEPAVLVLDPLLMGTSNTVAPRWITVSAIDGEGDPLPGVPVTIEQTLPDGSVVAVTVTTAGGGHAKVRFPLAIGDNLFVARWGTLESNGVDILGLGP